MRLLWLALVVACGAPAGPGAPAQAVVAPQPVAATPASAADPHAAIAARARADAALEQQLPPDYDRPFTSKPTDRSAIATLYDEACGFGDKRSCITAAQLAPLDEKATSYHTVAVNCVAGDQLSCRALPPDEHEARFPNAAGALSRRVECQKSRFDGGCDLAALHCECSDGFAAACAEIGFAVPVQPDAEAALDQMEKLSVIGCRGGLASECANVPPTSHNEYLHASLRVCDIRPLECSNLASFYKYSKQPVKERDAWERACEFGGRWSDCIELALGYVDGRLEEPVPGRGQALLEWSCRKLAEVKKTNPFEQYPQCTALDKH